MPYQENVIGVARNETLSASLLKMAESRKVEYDGINVDEAMRMLEVVGKGSFGSVYKAQHIGSGRIVAAKRLNYRLPQEHETIVREVTILRACDCEYIVGFYGSADVPGAMWIFMEFCPSVVSDVIEHSRENGLSFTEPEIRTVMVWLLQALAFLHAMDVIHRDVKADNLLLNAAGYPKLADFGVSGQMESPLTSMVGTPAFIAPEVVGAKPGDSSGYNEKVDIWAAGVTAIQCADLAEPYEGQNPFRVLFKIPTAPSPTLINPASRSAELNEFVAQCLRKNPNERPGAQQLLATAAFVVPAAGAHEGDAVAPPLLAGMNAVIAARAVRAAAAASNNGVGGEASLADAVANERTSTSSATTGASRPSGDESSSDSESGDGAGGPLSARDGDDDAPAAARDDSDAAKRRRRRERRERRKERDRTIEKGRSEAEVKALIREKKRRHQSEHDAEVAKVARALAAAGTGTGGSRASRRRERSSSNADETGPPPLPALLEAPAPKAPNPLSPRALHKERSLRGGGVHEKGDSAVRVCGMCRTGRAKVRADGVPLCLSCHEQKKREKMYAQCVAKRDFVGTGDEELAFERGDKIFIKESDANGWALGYVIGSPNDVGWFPLSNVNVSPEVLNKSAVLTPLSASTEERPVAKFSEERRESLAVLLAPRFAPSVSQSSATTKSGFADTAPLPRAEGADTPPPLMSASSARAPGSPKPSGVAPRPPPSRPPAPPPTAATAPGGQVLSPRSALVVSAPHVVSPGRSNRAPLPPRGDRLPATGGSHAVASTAAVAAAAASSSGQPQLLAGGELDLLLVALTNATTGIKLKREKIRFKRFDNCFQGASLVEWLQLRLRAPSKTALKDRALAQAADLLRRRAIIDVDDAATGASEFRGKSLYRFAYGDSSLPLNAARLYDDADDAWARRAALDTASWDKALAAMATDLKCAPGCVTANSYVTVSGGKAGTLVSDPMALSFTLLDEMVQLVQTAHAGQQLVQRDAFRAWAVRTGLLQRTPLDLLTDGVRLRFFANVFNMMIMHAYALPDAPHDEASHEQALTSVRYAFDESLYSPGDIWHGVLRGDTLRHLRFAADARKRTRVIPEASRDPLVSFALMRGTASDSPAVMPFGAADRTAMLMVAHALIFDHVQIDAAKYEVRVPAFLAPCVGDFGESTTEQLKFLARVLHDKKAKAFLIMHARSLEWRFVPTESWSANFNVYAAWVPQDDHDIWVAK